MEKINFFTNNVTYSILQVDQTVLEKTIFFNKTKIEEETNMILIQCPFECFINSDILYWIIFQNIAESITKLPE